MRRVTAERVYERIRSIIDQPASESGRPYITNPEIRHACQEEFEALWEAISQKDEGYFLPTTTIPFVADQTTYDLPANSDAVRMVWVRGSGSTESDRVELDRTPLSKLGVRHGYTLLEPGEYADDATVALGQIAVSPGVVQVGQMIELYYAQAPVCLTAGTLPSTNASDDHLTLDSDEPLIDGFFIGSAFYISSGTGAGQTRKATAFTGATKDLTLASVYNPKPTKGATYTTLVPLPGAAVRALASGTALRLLSKEDTPKLKAIEAIYERDWVALEDAIATHNRHQPLVAEDTMGYLDPLTDYGGY